MGAQGQSWIMDIVRSLFSALDSMVYGLINWILYGVFDLANLTTSSEVLNGIYSRIYVILGVFMAFKLCFSFFGYILDPESMVGKSEKSVPKLLMNAGIMLAALVVLPTILFNNGEGGGLLNRAQNAFLPMLPRVLLGINENSGLTVGNSNNTNSIDDAADVMALSTLQAFFLPPDELDELCGEGTLDKTPAITSIGDFTSNVNLTCNKTGTGIAGIGATRYYLYSYLWGISTIVGILMVFMLLGISIDVAKRVFKMIILQIVAPIPIMTLIDPKSKTKDGTFGKWLSMLISTFLDIFIKLGILYVVLMMIQLIVSKGLFTNFPEFTDQPLRAAYLIVFLILGLIFFAKEAPKFIKDSLGIKDSGAGMGVGFGAAAGALGGLIAGRGLSGAMTGAVAGATADPKVGGYAAGRDLAGQLRTGDKNWKGGFANTLSRASQRHQNAVIGRRMGITADTLAVAKNRSKKLEGFSTSAQDAYDRYKHGLVANPVAELQRLATHANAGMAGISWDAGTNQVVYTDDDGHITTYDTGTAEDQIAAMSFLASHSQSRADDAKSNHEKASKIAEGLGIGVSQRDKYTMSQRAKNRYNARHSSARNVDRTQHVIDRSVRQGHFDPGQSASSGNVDHL